MAFFLRPDCPLTPHSPRQLHTDHSCTLSFTPIGSRTLTPSFSHRTLTFGGISVADDGLSHGVLMLDMHCLIGSCDYTWTQCHTINPLSFSPDTCQTLARCLSHHHTRIFHIGVSPLSISPCQSGIAHERATAVSLSSYHTSKFFFPPSGFMVVGHFRGCGLDPPGCYLSSFFMCSLAITHSLLSSGSPSWRVWT